MYTMNNNNIYTTMIKTPIRTMFAASFKDELILFVPFEKEFIETKLEHFKKILDANEIIEDKKNFSKLEKELELYFSKKLKSFSIPLKLIGTLFQIEVWQELLKIPYGKTISYKEEAINIKKPKAYRAVANANGKNNLSIIVPCHRVVANNGNIGGYTGGIDIKEFLLKLENKEK